MSRSLFQEVIGTQKKKREEIWQEVGNVATKVKEIV